MPGMLCAQSVIRELEKEKPVVIVPHVASSYLNTDLPLSPGCQNIQGKNIQFVAYLWPILSKNANKLV